MRIIAKLDIKNNFVIKGINFEGLRKIGTPRELVKKYYIDGADEIIYQDCVASLYQRNSLIELIKETSENVFIPLTVGGGIRSLEDVNKLFKNGADKIFINSFGFENKKIFSSLVDKYGSQSIMLSIEAKKIERNKWLAYKNYGRDNTQIEVIEWIKEIIDYGVGEILIASIDHDGLKKGFDLELYNKVSKICSVPIIASGGYGNVDHIIDLKKFTNIEAVTLSSTIHYNLESIKKIKINLREKNIDVRL